MALFGSTLGNVRLWDATGTPLSALSLARQERSWPLEFGGQLCADHGADPEWIRLLEWQKASDRNRFRGDLKTSQKFHDGGCRVEGRGGAKRDASRSAGWQFLRFHQPLAARKSKIVQVSTSRGGSHRSCYFADGTTVANRCLLQDDLSVGSMVIAREPLEGHLDRSRP